MSFARLQRKTYHIVKLTRIGVHQWKEAGTLDRLVWRRAYEIGDSSIRSK